MSHVSARPRVLAGGLVLALAASLAVAAGTTPTTAPVVSAVATVVDPAVEDALATGATADVIVRVAPSARSAAGAVVAATGGSVTRDLPIVEGFEAALTADGLTRLTALGGVRAITLDGEVQLQSTTEGDGTTTQALDSSYVEHLGADDLHAQGITGTGVGIALIDTGVNAVTDLSGRVVHGLDLSGENNHVDSYGHGTFIAGVAAGNGAASAGEHAGVAPGAHIVSVKIAGASGSADVSNVLAAIQWVVSFKADHKIGVLNLSIGTDSTQSYTIDPLNYAVERAWAEGVVVVVAASNRGPNAGTISKPADDPWVITVGSLDSEGTESRSDDSLASFSGRGPTAADGIVKPDVVTPGVSLVGARAHNSTVANANTLAHVGADYMRASGTSFSAAAVSGAVALLRQAHPTWTPDQIKGALKASAVAGPVGDPNADGAGSVNVAAAAAMVDPAPANQGLTRSSGTGSMAASRGSLAVEMRPGGVSKVLDKSRSRTAQDDSWDSWDSEAYRTTSWNASSWYASSWYASSWYASSWYASSWYASSWYASSWY